MKASQTTTKRIYYKYDDFINGIFVGTLTQTETELSGFSATNYLKFPTIFTPNSSTIEAVIKFTTGSDISTTQGIMGSIGDSDGFTPFFITGGNLVCYLSSNGTSWNIASATVIMALSSNTTYIMKCTFTGTSYNFYKLDNDSWTLVKTITSSSTIYNNLRLHIGNNRGKNAPFLGTVDLKECYIKLDDVYYWKGILPEKTNEQDYDYYVDLPIYKIYKANNIYSAIKSWGEKQYYGT